jgi:hypothetical protein
MDETPPYELPQVNGTANPRYIDFLQVDEPISSQQKFVCCSFVSAENVIKSANEFYFEEYLKQYGIQYFAELMHNFVMFIKDKYKIDPDCIKEDLDDFIDTERKVLNNQLNISEKFHAFRNQFEKELRKRYVEANPLHNCTVRGFKVRGTFPTDTAANEMAAEYRANEPCVSTFVGPVGMWHAFDPTGATKVEYLEPELNSIYGEMLSNQKRSEELFKERVRTEKLQAYEANKALCERTGTVPTQVLDENGNLVNTRINPEILEARTEVEGDAGSLSENVKRRDKIAGLV